MPGFTGMAMCREGKIPWRENTTLEKNCRTASPWEDKKRKTNTKMEGQCRERPGVEGVGGGRCERLE